MASSSADSQNPEASLEVLKSRCEQGGSLLQASCLCTCTGCGPPRGPWLPHSRPAVPCHLLCPKLPLLCPHKDSCMLGHLDNPGLPPILMIINRTYKVYVATEGDNDRFQGLGDGGYYQASHGGCLVCLLHHLHASALSVVSATQQVHRQCTSRDGREGVRGGSHIPRVTAETAQRARLRITRCRHCILSGWRTTPRPPPQHIRCLLSCPRCSHSSCCLDCRPASGRGLQAGQEAAACLLLCLTKALFIKRVNRTPEASKYLCPGHNGFYCLPTTTTTKRQ